jgi:hypothetical protein
MLTEESTVSSAVGAPWERLGLVLGLAIKIIIKTLKDNI